MDRRDRLSSENWVVCPAAGANPGPISHPVHQLWWPWLNGRAPGCGPGSVRVRFSSVTPSPMPLSAYPASRSAVVRLGLLMFGTVPDARQGSRRGDRAPVARVPVRFRCVCWARVTGFFGLVAQWESTVLAGRVVGVRLPAGPPADRRTWVITGLPTTAPRSPFNAGHGLVAQSGEHRLRMAGCRGSTPRRSTEEHVYRDVVQSGRTLASGARARGFESLHPDQ
jgi:hypothetical protein